MRRFILLVTLMLTATFSFAQQEEKEQESLSKTLNFLKKDGTCLIKEFYDLETVGDVVCQVLIITDVVSNSKIGCLRLKTYSSATHISYIGTLDSDEIEACIKSLDYMKDSILITAPIVYTEAVFTTRDKVSIGIYYAKKDWTAFVKTRNYLNYSMQTFSSRYLDKLREQMIKAKEIILDKTK